MAFRTDEDEAPSGTDPRDEEDEPCEGCGRTASDPGQCPLCCGSVFSPTAPECDECPSEFECNAEG